MQEILREPYSGRSFPGHDKIDLSFQELETLVRNSRPDWMAALGSAKGIYLITDTSTGFRYVGSAYWDRGVWYRWCDYVATGHGGNVKLRKIVDVNGISHCRDNFRFTLLEQCLSQTLDNVILDRETFWKDVLRTRGEHGLN